MTDLSRIVNRFFGMLFCEKFFCEKTTRPSLWWGVLLLVVACGPARKVREPELQVELVPPAGAVLGRNQLAVNFDNPSWRQRMLVVQLVLQTPAGKGATGV